MSNIESALNLVENLIYKKTGEHLNDLQRIILKECWQDTKKTYDRIATEYGYSANYIKQGVGPKLWRLLSLAMSEKVTKSNFNGVVERHLAQQKQVSVSVNKVNNISSEQTDNSFQEVSGLELELPLDSVPLGSPFYIQRTPHESRCYQEITNASSFIRIKAPRQMGKSSLMHRVIDYAKKKEYETALIHFQQAEANLLKDIDRFLRWFCANLARQLKLKSNLEEYWDDFLGAKMSCTYYLQEYILESIDAPLVIALEEVNEVIEYVETAQEFLTLLRFWHEKTKTDPSWQKLRIVMVHSTEIYIPLDINQSPLNVGLRIELEPFNREQVINLISCHGMSLNDLEIERLMNLVGGYPYLIRRALYHLARRDLTLEELIVTAPTDAGIYSDLLHRHLRNLETASELITVLKLVLQEKKPVKIEQIAGFKLHSMGLVELDGNLVSISCDLYQKYFCDRFLDS